MAIGDAVSSGSSGGQPQIQVPVAASTELALTAVNALRAEMSIRHDAAQQRMDIMDAAVRAQHEDMVRVPTEVQKATTALREFLEQVIARTAAEISHVKGRQIEAVHGEINTAIATLHGEINTQISRVTGKIDENASVSEERFKGVQTQFMLLKQATEQLDVANKTAIAAALQAQKESAGETQKTSQAAIAKSENSTSEAIRTLTATFQQQLTATTDRINDLKSRLDRGEGRSSSTEPATAGILQRMEAKIESLGTSRDTGGGAAKAKDDTWKTIGMIGGILIAALALYLKSGGLQ